MRNKILIAVFGFLWIFFCGPVISRAEVNVTPAGTEVQIPIQTEKSFNFRIPDFSQKKNIVLELDARVQIPGISGYNEPAVITLNGKVIDGPRLVNKPPLAKLVNGDIWPWCHPGNNAWCLYYAQSFEIIGQEVNQYRPAAGISGPHFAFDVSDIAQAENVLTIKNIYTRDIQKAMGGSACPIVVANIKVNFPEQIVKAEEQNLSPFSYAVPPYVTPRKNWKVEYKFNLDKDGGFVVDVGGKSFPFAAYFSYPGGGYNTFSGQKEGGEKTWQVLATKINNNCRIKGEGEFYRVIREIRLKDDRIDISDTIFNKSDKDLGVIIKNQTDIGGAGVERFFRGGGEILQPESSGGSPENPTLYLAASGAGIGLVPVDDVFRVHHASYFVKGQYAGLKDEMFALPPQGEYTMEWSVYPTLDSNYFTFINAIRRDWDLNSLLARGCEWGIAAGREIDDFWGLASDKFPSTSLVIPKDARVRRPEVKYVEVSLPQSKGVTEFGYPMLKLNAQIVENYKTLIADAKRELGPEKKIIGLYGPVAFSMGEESKSLFKDCRITLPNGEQAVWGTLFDPASAPLYFPTETNALGGMMTKICDQWFDWGAEGMYFDFFDPSTSGYAYTYNTWDGHTAEIDPATKTIKRKFASIDLLSCKFLAGLIKRIEDRGGVIFANRGITTKTSTEASKNIPRLGEAGLIQELLRTHLTPCPAGYQRTHLKDIHSQLLGALDYGILTYPFDSYYSFTDNPIAKIFPIKVKELHQGYVIGENKIVTKRSGVFGWGDKSQITCYLYDKEGHPVPNDFPTVIENGNAFVNVNLLPDQVVILERSSS